jgi:hypothetical protein
MSLPKFENSGQLPVGIHSCSGSEFIELFCSSDLRHQFIKPVSEIFDFAFARGAQYIFVGGSFITGKENPGDFDAVIVFPNDSLIPSKTEKIVIEGLIFDILYASLENPKLIDTFIKLFSTTRHGQDTGIVQVNIASKDETWVVEHEPDAELFESVKKTYNQRSVIDINYKEGILVSIHGLSSKAEWNMNIAPVASSQNWIFAPYIYQKNSRKLLFSEKRRRAVVDDFREWIYDLQQKYNVGISVVAHSFGTYIVAAYLMGFDSDEKPPVKFNSIILTGSILHENFNWGQFSRRCLGNVYNMTSSNDRWVKMMPAEKWRKYFGMSDLFGRSGVNGFENEFIVTESRNEIFNHNNTIKTDIIETKWMPFLNGNKNTYDPKNDF